MLSAKGKEEDRTNEEVAHYDAHSTHLSNSASSSSDIEASVLPNIIGVHHLISWEDASVGVRVFTILPNGWFITGKKIKNYIVDKNDSDYYEMIKTIQCWQVDSKTGEARCLSTWKGHPSCVTALIVLPNGLVLSGGWDGNIRCWQVNKKTGEGQRLSKCKTAQKSVNTLVILSNGWVLSGGANSIQCWKVNKKTGKLRCLSTYQSPLDINVLVVLPNGLVLSGGWDGILSWQIDQKTGEIHCLSTLNMPPNEHAEFLVMLPNGWVVSGDCDGREIFCWQVDEITGEVQCLSKSEESHPYSRRALTVLPNGWILSASLCGEIRCWRVDKTTGKITCLMTTPRWPGLGLDYLNTFAVLPNGRLLSGSDCYEVRCWKGIEEWVKVRARAAVKFLCIARIILLDIPTPNNLSSLPIEVKRMILQYLAGPLLSPKEASSCIDYAENRSTLSEKENLMKNHFLYHIFSDGTNRGKSFHLVNHFVSNENIAETPELELQSNHSHSSKARCCIS